MNAEEYDRMFRYEGDYWWYVGRRHLVHTLIKQWIGQTENPLILDIGCGTGAMAKDLQQYGNVIGCDLRHTALEYCRKRSLSELVQGDITNLPFQDHSFDLIVALDILEHVPDDAAALKELRRVLKPNGRLVVTVPAYQFLWGNHDLALGHVRRYTARELKRKVKTANFRVSKMSHALSLLFPVVALMRVISRCRDKNKAPEASIIPLPNWANSALEGLQQMESNIIRHVSLPVGVTVVAVLEPCS